MTPDHFDFSHALALLKQGKRVAREAWKEWGEMAYVAMHPRWPAPSIYAHGAKGEYTWQASQPDLLAEDWHEVTG